MSSHKLSAIQIKTLQKYGLDFKEWLTTKKGKEEIKSHREHEKYFNQKLSQNNIRVLSENEFSDLWKNTWASRMWTNKDWYVKNKLISTTSVEKIKDELENLLYGKDNFIDRYDKFRQDIQGFGVAFISEVLNMIFPNKFCLWNITPRNVLNFLGFTDLPTSILNNRNLSGSQYIRCNDYLNLIKDELSEFGIKDFIDLDVFFWYISEYIMPSNSEETPEKRMSNYNDTSKLEYLINAYDENNNFFGPVEVSEEEVIRGQKEFISDFPSEKIQQLKIEEYVVGKINPNTGSKNENTFCYRLEYGFPGFGSIKGTPNDKYGIYCNQKTQEYVYDFNKYDSSTSAFESIKSQIITILEAGKKVKSDNNWNEMARVMEGEFDIRRHIRSKILAVYYPETFLRIHSEKNAHFILEKMYGIPEEKIPEGLFLKQKKILELKNQNPITKKWSMNKYSRFIWDAKEEIQKNYDIKNNFSSLKNDFKVWVVRAGKKGEQEKDALDKNVVTIGWNDFDDLSTFQNKNEIVKKYSQIRPDIKLQSVESMSNSIWLFTKQIRQGDLVFIPLVSTDKQFVAIGQVNGDYQYTQITKDVKHIRKVIWLDKKFPISSFTKEVIAQLGRPPTVYEIKDNETKESILNVLEKKGIIFYAKDKQNDDKGNNFPEKSISIDDLVGETYFPKEWIEEIEQLLNEKKQIIFYGPPGTGKTFFAKKFAKYFTKENYDIIQFHPSYSYEDFIEGIKPSIDEYGKLGGFSRQEGFFKKFVKKCHDNPQNKFLLIIDEINRGNISRIFGELIYLLEYRDDKITLTYSPEEKFSIPKNLYIIGTMNSADRSISFVDYALRRRFLFFEFYPDLHNSNILRKWFEDNEPSKLHSENIIKMLEDINKVITDKLGREYQIGQSYFMKSNMDKKSLERIITYAILPLVEQYFFGKKERIDEIKQIYYKSLADNLSLSTTSSYNN